jgi:hypothetical protein
MCQYRKTSVAYYFSYLSEIKTILKKNSQNTDIKLKEFSCSKMVCGYSWRQLNQSNGFFYKIKNLKMYGQTADKNE